MSCTNTESGLSVISQFTALHAFSTPCQIVHFPSLQYGTVTSHAQKLNHPLHPANTRLLKRRIGTIMNIRRNRSTERVDILFINHKYIFIVAYMLTLCKYSNSFYGVQFSGSVWAVVSSISQLIWDLMRFLILFLSIFPILSIASEKISSNVHLFP